VLGHPRTAIMLSCVELPPNTFPPLYSESTLANGGSVVDVVKNCGLAPVRFEPASSTRTLLEVFADNWFARRQPDHLAGKMKFLPEVPPPTMIYVNVPLTFAGIVLSNILSLIGVPIEFTKNRDKPYEYVHLKIVVVYQTKFLPFEALNYDGSRYFRAKY
jgi:hypothetical protein